MPWWSWRGASCPGRGSRREQLEALPGLCLHDLMLLPIDRLGASSTGWRTMLLASCRRQMRAGGIPCRTPTPRPLKADPGRNPRPACYLRDAGIGYLTLDRQSRTLSGGEVQRINLTTALGTSLVNTLFVLDEPSIGLHPRDMDRITQAMQRLEDAGNTWWWWNTTRSCWPPTACSTSARPRRGRRAHRVRRHARRTAPRRHADRRSTWAGANRRRLCARTVGEHAAPDPGRRHRAQPERDGGFPLQRLVTVTGVSARQVQR